MSNKFERPIPRVKYRAIPEPQPELRSLMETVRALKETVELLTRQRNNPDPPVFWSDLERMGIVKPEDQVDPWTYKHQR